MKTDGEADQDPTQPVKRKKASGVINQTIRVKSGKDLVNYCYVLINREINQAVVIDPAWEIDKIEAVLKARKCKLSAILLTHHHNDHTNLANDLAVETGADVYMSACEISEYDFTCTNLRAIEEPRISAAGMQIDVIETPGHTAGSVCFATGDYLFTGDTLFIEGCGVCTGWGASASQLFDSLTTIKEGFADDTRIFPGHRFRESPGKSLQYVKENNVYLQVEDRTGFVNLHTRDRDFSEIQYL